MKAVTIPEAKARRGFRLKSMRLVLTVQDILQRQGLYPMPPGVTQVPGLEVAGERSLQLELSYTV